MNFLRLLGYLPFLIHGIIPLCILTLVSFFKVVLVFLTMLLMPAVFDRLFTSFDVWVLVKIVVLQLFLLGFTLLLDSGILAVAAHLQHKLSLHIKVSMLRKSFRYPFSFFTNSNSGELSKLIMTDTESVSTGIREMVLMFSNILQGSLMAIGCYYTAEWLFKLYMGMIITYLVWTVGWKRIAVYLMHNYSRVATKAYGFMWGSLGAFREIKILGLEEKSMETFTEIQRKHKRVAFWHDAVNSWTSVLGQPLAVLSFAIVLYICLQKIQSGEYSLGMMAAFTSMVYILLTPIVQVVTGYTGVQIGMVGASLLKDLKSGKKEKSGSQKWSTLEKGIEIKNVSFSYNESRQILKDIHFKIKPGQHIALVGHTGCGKSTLLSLLLKLFQEYDGEILLDGKPLQSLDNDSLRDHISYLGQDSLCFLGNVRENIDVKGVLSDEEILKICEKVQLMPVLERMSGGLSEEVNDTSLSGGEKQRLFLARSIAKSAEVLLFDEATSALDPQTESLILDTLKDIRKGKTCITVAHRVSNIKECDWIYVMSEGEIVEHGKYEDLMEAKGPFYNLFYS